MLWDIESDPALAGTKLIAEAWDAAGLVPGRQLRRRQLEGVERAVPRRRARFLSGRRRVRSSALADRLLGSPEIYGHKEREAEQSVNFVTCHDGFTLNDLVSYNQKHNEANGEDNRDGTNDNRSWNAASRAQPMIRRSKTLRNRQVKNFLAVTMLSLGLPMILMGDEVRRTQRQQQRLLPGQRDQLVRLDAARQDTPTCIAS